MIDSAEKPLSHEDLLAERFQEGAVAVVRIDGQKAGRWHDHSYFELVFILSGHGVHVTEKERYPVSVGDVFVIPPYHPHDYDQPDNLSLVNVLYDPRKLSLPLLDLDAMPGYQFLFAVEPILRRQTSRLCLELHDLAQADELVTQIHRTLRRREAGFRFRAAVRFLDLVDFVCRKASFPEKECNPQATGLAGILSRMARQPEQPVVLDDLAREASMSKRSLLRAFQQLVGMSPLAYLSAMRARRACELLERTQVTISEIGEAVGYDDSNYFSRQFRKVTGQSPRAYRQAFPQRRSK